MEYEAASCDDLFILDTNQLEVSSDERPQLRDRRVVYRFEGVKPEAVHRLTQQFHHILGALRGLALFMWRSGSCGAPRVARSETLDVHAPIFLTRVAGHIHLTRDADRALITLATP
jgi:hypothetical protein